MSCPKTEHILQEYFADDLAPLASEEIERHLAQCEHCSAELEALLLTREQLTQWKDADVPHWNRGMDLYRNEHSTPAQSRNWFSFLQWAPTAASFAMLALLFLNTTVTVNGSSVSFSFGAGSDDAVLAAAMTEFQQQQTAELQSVIARFEERQDSSNIQLLQAVMAQTQQTTADSLDRIYAYFEEQRLQDMETLRASYQQLADSDYATIQSLQDLAQYVSFQGGGF